MINNNDYQIFNDIVFTAINMILQSDESFNLLYPDSLQDIADTHFTPIEVSKIASAYLSENAQTKILDIGSGAGKFCIIGSTHTNGRYTGIEQRASLHQIASDMLSDRAIPNLNFIHGNVTDHRFTDYDAFYCFNPFYENICPPGKMNDEVEINTDFYDLYSVYVKDQLDSMPIGTRLVTYFSYLHEVPDTYQLMDSQFDDKLKMWKKMS